MVDIQLQLLITTFFFFFFQIAIRNVSMLRVENVIRSNRGCYDISYCGGFEWKRQNEFRANIGPTKDTTCIAIHQPVMPGTRLFRRYVDFTLM